MHPMSKLDFGRRSELDRLRFVTGPHESGSANREMNTRGSRWVSFRFARHPDMIPNVLRMLVVSQLVARCVQRYFFKWTRCRVPHVHNVSNTGPSVRPCGVS
jgi:hypothetical protein